MKVAVEFRGVEELKRDLARLGAAVQGRLLQLFSASAWGRAVESWHSAFNE